MEDPWLPIEEVCRKARRCDRTVRKALKTGALEGEPVPAKRGNPWRIRTSACRAWIRNECRTWGESSASEPPPGHTLPWSGTFKYLNLPEAVVKRNVNAGRLRLYGDVVLVRDLDQFIRDNGGIEVIPLIGTDADTGEVVDVGVTRNGIEALDDWAEDYYEIRPDPESRRVIWP